MIITVKDLLTNNWKNKMEIDTTRQMKVTQENVSMENVVPPFLSQPVRWHSLTLPSKAFFSGND